MKVYSRNEAVPAVAVTLATRGDRVQPILFTSQLGGTDTYSGWVGRSLDLVITFAKVTILRDWSTSQAQLELVAPITRDGKIATLPDLSLVRGGNNPYLGEDDEIRIYMGYLPSRKTPITADLLDEHPIDLIYPDDPHVVTFTPGSKELFKSDCTRPLCPVFWGFIDTINFVGNSKSGCKYVILCRDRTRVLADTKLISIPSLLGSGKAGATGLRHRIAREVIKASTGRLFSTGNVAQDAKVDANTWKEVVDGETHSTWDLANGEIVNRSQQTAAADTQPEEDPALWVRYATHMTMDIKARPRSHVWVQRPPLNKSNGAQVFNVINVNPLEVLSYLAQTEERPTDFFASHVNGDYVLAPRVMDTSGFYDPQRMYRTYFFMQWPCGMAEPLDNQKIISLRVLSSSVATFNRFVVAATDTSGGNASFLQNIQVVLTHSPWELHGRKYTDIDSGEVIEINPPSRNQIISDSNLSTYDNKVGGALILALNAAAAFGRDAKGVEFSILGDPTFYPGEAVRLYNTVLHDEKVMVHLGNVDSVKEANDASKGISALGNIPDEKLKRDKYVYGKDDYDGILNHAGLGQTSKAPDSLVLPVYKVRNVQHIFTAKGDNLSYVTRIRAVSNYG